MENINEGQQMFLSFILERVKEGRSEEAKALLMENFRKQAEGTFTAEDIKAFIPKMMELLQPDKIEEVQAITREFAARMQK